MKLRHHHGLIPDEVIVATGERLRSYIAELSAAAGDRRWSKPENCLSLATDQALLDDLVHCRAKKIKNNLKYVVVIGIGGSSLGAKAVYDALNTVRDPVVAKSRPQLIFLDSIQPARLAALSAGWEKALVKPEEILVVVITKSGHTIETVVNTEIVLQSLQRLLVDVTDQVVVITTTDSLLGQLAVQRHLPCLPIPHVLSGRFSVFSAVGLFPLLAGGLDIVGLREGASAALTAGLSTDWLNNPALVSAAILYHHQQAGRSLVDHFLFAPELATWGQWCRQLMAESLGKNGTGITPLVSVGSTDLHSMTQLHLAGPPDKVIVFAAVEHQQDLTVPPGDMFDGWAGRLVGRSTREINQSLYAAATRAYQEAAVPFLEVAIDELNAHSLGELLQWKMLETIFLAKLLEVNAFDQPAIEGYKKHVFAI
jgi:glucose-6-phosphate isomerase